MHVPIAGTQVRFELQVNNQSMHVAVREIHTNDIESGPSSSLPPSAIHIALLPKEVGLIKLLSYQHHI